jgi:undecaprenyl-diphosphatase
VNAWLQSLLLGIIQGLTEFLPVSSSGHLVLFQQWLGESFSFQNEAVAFDLALHIGTLLPVIYFYRAEVGRITESVVRFRRDESFDMALFVVLATIPTGLMGILLEDVFQSLFHSVRAVCIALLVTGSLLLSTRFFESGPDQPKRQLTWWVALVIGIAQGFAITPGISRSGTTIAVALLLGMDRAVAARFSFLLSIPAILGAAVLIGKDGIPIDAGSAGPLVLGFLASMIVGYLALWMLVALVKRGGLYRFTYYVWPVAVVGLILDAL